MSRSALSRSARSRSSTLVREFGAGGTHADVPKRTPPGRRLDIETGEGLFHVFVCGAPGVGKTSLVTRYCQNRFPTWYDPIDVAHHSVETISSHRCLFEFLEGSEIDSLVDHVPNYGVSQGIAAVDALILVYDVGSRSSFAQLAEGYKNIIWKTGKTGLPAAVVANKFDIFQDSRAVSEEEGRELAGATGAVFAQCSAREGDGVREVVKLLMARAVEARLKEIDEKEKRERLKAQERELEELERELRERAKIKRTMSGRIMSRLSWGPSYSP